MEITQAIKAEAKQAALDWMALVDGCDFKTAHQAASAFFQSKVSAEELGELLSDVQAKTGPLGERSLLSVTYYDALPEAPAGDYLVMQFVSQSQDSNKAVETITPVYEAGQWRIGGYYVNQS